MRRGFCGIFIGLTLGACDDGDVFRPTDRVDARVVDQFVPSDMRLDARADPNDDFGEACAEGAQCRSGFCVAAADGRVCSRRCGNDGDCPDAWFCRQVTNPGADITFICVPEDAPCLGADLRSDPDHCGACEAACAFPAAEAECVAGACVQGHCLAGFHDLDGSADDGCEYACTVTREGVEACDAIDNDCDGATDEGFDLQVDLEHCGDCGAACRPVNAEGRCAEGACAIVACAEGFLDLDADPANGCEVGCRPSNDGVEACDRIDNDCDGVADEGFDLSADPTHCGGCNRACARPNAQADCAEGMCRFVACLPDFYDRNGDPSDGCEVGCQRSNDGVEACDGVDNDCDGPADEGFDLSVDPTHCGDCATDCTRPQAQVACIEARCRFVACQDGFHDLDADPATGCEYACALNGDEACNGGDDDCDGATDEGFDLEGDAAHCGRCGAVCDPPRAMGACVAGRCTVAECAEGFFDLDRDAENGCEYACAPAGAERCNDADDDCDGAADEDFDLRRDVEHCGGCDQPCALPNGVPSCVEGRCGLAGCQEGFANPDGRAETGCECRIAPEVCNGRDDDCDGAADEGIDTRNDPQNCGGCGDACALENATPVCIAGECDVGRCADGFGDADGDAENGCECAVAGAEACNLGDDDCDGRVDEGFDLDSDVRHCGGCDRRCLPPNASPLCNRGRCRVDRCLAGFADVDGEPENGCECRLDNRGVEACDGRDNDCDGRVDEGFDQQNDVAHCGACHRACAVQDNAPVCVEGRCRVGDCDPGFVDADGDPRNGCEIDCAVAGDGVPECEGPVDLAGTFDLAPPPRYSCRDLFFGEVVFTLDARAVTFTVDGGTLNVQGLNTGLSQTPAGADGRFDARGSVAGDCREDFFLQGQFDTPDTFSAALRVEFVGDVCGFTECTNQLFRVTGTRR